MPVSFSPDTFTEGGGLWDNKDVRFTNARFQSDWDYGGKSQTKTPALLVDLIDMETGEEIIQGWSVGKADDYAASLDGKKASQQGDFLLGPQLRKGSNVVFLLQSIIDATADDKKAELHEKVLANGQASSLNGLEAHMIRQVVKREGLVKKVRADGKVFEDTVPVVDVIHKYPWEKAVKAVPGATKAAVPAGKPVIAGKPAAAKPAAAVAAKPAAAVVDYDPQTTMLVGQVVSENPGIARETMCSDHLFLMVKEVKARNEVIKRAFDGEWLTANAESGGWVFDPESDTLTMAE